MILTAFWTDAWAWVAAAADAPVAWESAAGTGSARSNTRNEAVFMA